MKRKLEILLVEDDIGERKKLADFINDSDDFKLTGQTDDAKKALELINEFKPDAIILDLELHTGRGSGITLLHDMKGAGLSKIPYILVTTNNISTIILNETRSLGADFIISKHQPDYSASSVLDHLSLMSTAILDKPDSLSMQDTTGETAEQYNSRINRCIMSELNKVGISPKHKGYKYLTDAITIMIKQPAPNICAFIAEKYGKSEGSIERAMQYSINRAWTTSNPDELYTHYTAKIDRAKGSPTITEFVCYYANKIKNEY